MQHPALKPEDLIGIPWRITLALQADGWYLRADVIWAKPNSMPEPARDRPTRSHEYVFLLSKSRRYYYDAGAIAEPAVSDHPSANRFVRRPQRTHGNRGNGTSWTDVGGKRNRRDVWQFKSEPSRRREPTTDAHFATFPTELAQVCILAGSQPEGLVLDPFAGAGTVGEASERLARRWIGVELSTEYGPFARRRTAQMGLPFKHTLLDSQDTSSPSGREKIDQRSGAGFSILKDSQRDWKSAQLQSGLRVRIDCAPPASLDILGFSESFDEFGASGAIVDATGDRRIAILGSTPQV